MKYLVSNRIIYILVSKVGMIRTSGMRILIIRSTQFWPVFNIINMSDFSYTEIRNLSFSTVNAGIEKYTVGPDIRLTVSCPENQGWPDIQFRPD